tara:strand:- start:516 stop:668 length:153 start_codon:yes stop_codon:yes gene_type:complete
MIMGAAIAPAVLRKLRLFSIAFSLFQAMSRDKPYRAIAKRQAAGFKPGTF